MLVPKDISTKFKDALKKAHAERFPSGVLHPDIKWSRIVNPQHFRRLKDLMERTEGKILAGGEVEGEARIALTIYTDVKVDDALMEE